MANLKIPNEIGPGASYRQAYHACKHFLLEYSKRKNSPQSKITSGIDIVFHLLSLLVLALAFYKMRG